MNLSAGRPSPEAEEFRLDLAADIDSADIGSRLESLIASWTPGSDPAAFLGRQFDLGLAWVHFPVGLGGLGLDRSAQGPIDTALQAVEAPTAATRNIIGFGMAAPTLVTEGTPSQQVRYLRPLFTGDEVWCQLFSEPGAGSDLASLGTRAIPDGDGWRVTGQKVWTSFAHCARWGLLLARTDTEAPKHRGLTYFVLDMLDPGVEVRPLIQMTGDAEFNEVYLSDAWIPDAERIGAVGDGWRVALTTLTNERTAIGGQLQPRGGGGISDALDVWRGRAHSDGALRDRLVELWIQSEALRLTNARVQQTQAGKPLGPEGSIMKLFAAELNQRISEFTLELMGAEGMLKSDGYRLGRPDEGVRPGPGMLWGNPVHTFLRARANSIEGGTSEIMRNILAERILGLPADARADKNLPWSQVRRS